jgi:hypothetical protein
MARNWAKIIKENREELLEALEDAYSRAYNDRGYQRTYRVVVFTDGDIFVHYRVDDNEVTRGEVEGWGFCVAQYEAQWMSDDAPTPAEADYKADLRNALGYAQEEYA